jgi:hypothetical protein
VADVAWRTDLDDAAADPEGIAAEDLVVGETLHGEVPAKIRGHKI